jgi:hypothetical protein
MTSVKSTLLSIDISADLDRGRRSSSEVLVGSTKWRVTFRTIV